MTKAITTVIAMVSTIEAAGAPFNKDSSKKVVARADIDTGNIRGVIKFQAPNGTVRAHLDITGLPKDGGPFQYHIHKLPVPANGDCDATSTHFNPYNASPDCASQEDDSQCQVGDLSGKHGWINTTCFETRYWDPYLSLNPKNKAYPVGLSVTFHYANLTRFACANIYLSKEKVDKKDEDEMEELIPHDTDLSQEFKELDAQETAAFAAKRDEEDLDLYEETTMSSPSTKMTTSPKNYSNSSNGTNLYWQTVSENGGYIGMATPGSTVALIGAFLGYILF